MISEKSKVIFLMPPKTASNSIKKVLQQSGVEITTIPNLPVPDIHLFLSEIVGIYNIKNISEYKIVQVTRNPKERFASSYYHQKRILKNIETNLDGLSFEEFAVHLKDCLLSSKSFFDRFYGRTDFIYKLISNGKSWGGTRLYLNQHQWNDIDANVTYFKLEDLSKDITPLAKHLGINLSPLPKVNTNKTEVDYNDLYNEETSNIVTQVFKKDYEILGYGDTH